MGTVDTRVARRGYFRISLLAGVYYLFAASNPFDIPRRRVNRSADHRVCPAQFPRANVNVLIPLGRVDIDSRMTERRSVVEPLHRTMQVVEIAGCDLDNGISHGSECGVSLRRIPANSQLATSISNGPIRAGVTRASHDRTVPRHKDDFVPFSCSRHRFREQL